MTCAQNLNPYSTSGEEGTVLVMGALGTLTASNTGGSSIGTTTTQVYASTATSVEYAVTYKTATASAGSDTLVISDSGSMSSLTIPVTIVNPTSDSGASAFYLYTTSGTVCPGDEVSFGTQSQGNATPVLSTQNTNLVSIAQNGMGVFLLNFLAAGSGIVTATAGPSSVIYPMNIPLPGFSSSC